MSTKSDEPTTRDERYGDGGTNGVFENNFAYPALTGNQVSRASWSGGVL